MALSEVELLLADEVREPRTYLAILQAIGGGYHTLDEIANASLVGKSNLSAYLAQLDELLKEATTEERRPWNSPDATRLAVDARSIRAIFTKCRMVGRVGTSHKFTTNR